MASRAALAEEMRGDLARSWREEGKPKRRGAKSPSPITSLPAFERNFHEWLTLRGIADCLLREPERDAGSWVSYRYVGHTPAVTLRGIPNSVVRWHGTWFYALWSILATGIVLPSEDEEKGHWMMKRAGDWIRGVYVTSTFMIAERYARPQVVFDRDCYFRVIIEVFCDPLGEICPINRTAETQNVFSPAAVAISRILINPNSSVSEHEERMSNWNSVLEARPAGSVLPSVTPRSVYQGGPDGFRIVSMPAPGWAGWPANATQAPAGAPVQLEDMEGIPRAQQYEYDEIFGALLERVRQPPACGYCGCEGHHPYGTNMEEEDVILANGPATMYVKLKRWPMFANGPHDVLENFEVWQWDPEHQEGPTLQCAGMEWATYEEEQVRPHWPVTDMTLHIVIGRRTSSG